jgi:hypothetical protein
MTEFSDYRAVGQMIDYRSSGRLWATPNDGPGTTFSFSIPHRARGS